MNRDRPAKLLRRLERSSAPRAHVAVTVTADQRALSSAPYGALHTLRVGHARYWEWRRGRVSGEVSFSFTTAESFWHWLCARVRPRGSTWIWMSVADYCYPILEGWAAREREILTRGSLIADERLWIYFARRGSAALTFLSLTNWLKSPLADLAEPLGHALPPLPEPWDSDAPWALYAERECALLAAAVGRILAWHGAVRPGPLSATAAGQSLRLYSARAAVAVEKDALPGTKEDTSWHDRRPCLYPIPHHREDALTLERAAFCGLQPDVYRLGTVSGPVVHLDATSFYPALERANLYPCRLVDRLRRPRVRELAPWLATHGLCALVRVETCDYAYPVRMDIGTVRAHGNYWTVLAAPELRYAVEHDEVRAVALAHVYEERDLFGPYVNLVLDLRAAAQSQGDVIGAALAKTLANSLHGKFGQRLGRWQDMPKMAPRRPWGRWLTVDSDTGAGVVFRAIGGDVQRQLAAAESVSSFPAIPAWVCSYARLALHRWRQIALESNVFYTHVDSLHTTPEGAELLRAAGEIRANEPGALRVVGEWDEVHYYGPSRYIADGVPTVSGLTPTACEVDQKTWEQDALVRTVQMIHARPPGGAIVTRRTTSLTEHIRAGSVTDSGWIVPAFLDQRKEGPPALEWLEESYQRG